MNNKIKEFNKNAIDTISFLKKYYGIINENLNRDKLTHQNLSTLFPQLKRVSNDFVLKNPELIYTGKVIFVKDANNYCAPYRVFNILENDYLICDRRESLICNILLTIKILVNNLENGLIILENNDDIFQYIKGKRNTTKSIECINLNNVGGILIHSIDIIYTFDYLVYNNYQKSTNFSQNSYNSFQLSKMKDIISISIVDGDINVFYKGIFGKNLSICEVKKFLLHVYSPKEKIDNNLLVDRDLDVTNLRDFELEKLLKKYYKERSFDKYHLVRNELYQRHKNIKNKQKKEKIKRKKYNWED